MNYKTYLPDQRLSPFVKYFYTLETVSNSDDQLKTLRIIADGCPGILFQSPEKGALSVDDKKLPTAFLYGQSTKHADLFLNGNFATIGVCLQPNAVKVLFGLNAEPLTDSCAGIDEVAKGGEILSERLEGAASADKKIELLSNFMIASLSAGKPVQEKEMQYAMNRILDTSGSVPLKSLLDDLRMSERSFGRKFKQYIGITPKLFARICSFQSSLKQMKGSQFDKLSDIAYEHNYADQSHFIRSFREFAGLSPNQYQKQSTEVIENLSELIR